MKRFNRVIGAMAAAIALIGLPIAASAGIATTKHDATTGGWDSATGEICVVCHIPHNADTTNTNAPLWNHTLTTQAYTPYANPSGTLTATDLASSPSGISQLCLSCHDGTVAVDSFGGSNNQGGGGTLIADLGTGSAELGTDLSNDHPVSFTYDDTLASDDGGLHPPTTTAAAGLGGNINVTMLFGSNNDQLECASCHDPHDNTNPPFLIKSNATSALCLTCHDK